MAIIIVTPEWDQQSFGCTSRPFNGNKLFRHIETYAQWEPMPPLKDNVS